MKLATRSVLLFLFSFALACTSAVPPQPVEPAHVVIVGTTDVHGWIDGHEEKLEDGTTFRSGGLDVFGSYVDILRAANRGSVVLVDSGDMFQGTLASNLNEGEAVIGAYNLLGYSAAAVGNHEFDFGPVGEKSVAMKPGDDPLGALKRDAARAKFPLLGANILEKATGKRPHWLKPHTMVTVDGVKVGIIGVITEDTPLVTNPANVETLTFTDAAEAVTASAAELRSQGAAAIIVISHIGGECKNTSDPRDATSCRIDSHVFNMARALPAGAVDAIFGGHTHQQVRQFVNGIAVVQGAPLGRGFGVVDLYVDRAKMTTIAEKTEIRPLVAICERVFSETGGCNPRNGKGSLVAASFDGKPVAPRADVQQAMRPYIASVEQKKKEKLGIRVAAPFTREYRKESALGNLIADLLRANLGTDFAFVNSGGLRSDLRGPDVTFGEMFEVLPFDNFATKVRLTGAQLKRIFELGILTDHGTLQISGLKLVIEPAKTAGGTPAVTMLYPDGRPIPLEGEYTVGTIDFLVGGGGVIGEVMKALPAEKKEIYYDRVIRDVAISELKKSNAPLQPKVEGRIVIRE